jgi:hypothetical protein
MSVKRSHTPHSSLTLASANGSQGSVIVFSDDRIDPIGIQSLNDIVMYRRKWSLLPDDHLGLILFYLGSMMHISICVCSLESCYLLVQTW